MLDSGAIAASLSALGAATVTESGARAMSDTIRPVWPGARVVGPAIPVTCTPGDNLALHVALAEAPAGSVIVANVGDIPDLGYWGEILSTAAVARGILGVVLDGGVRDVNALEAMKFPAFSATIALRGTSRLRSGTVGGTATVGEALVEFGDWVVADVDGVAIVPSASVEDVIAAGRARAQQESRYIEQLKAGRTTIEILGLDPEAVSVHLPRPTG